LAPDKDTKSNLAWAGSRALTSGGASVISTTAIIHALKKSNALLKDKNAPIFKKIRPMLGVAGIVGGLNTLEGYGEKKLDEKFKNKLSKKAEEKKKDSSLPWALSRGITSFGSSALIGGATLAAVHKADKEVSKKTDLPKAVSALNALKDKKLVGKHEFYHKIVDSIKNKKFPREALKDIGSGLKKHVKPALGVAGLATLTGFGKGYYEKKLEKKIRDKMEHKKTASIGEDMRNDQLEKLALIVRGPSDGEYRSRRHTFGQTIDPLEDMRLGMTPEVTNAWDERIAKIMALIGNNATLENNELSKQANCSKGKKFKKHEAEESKREEQLEKLKYKLKK
jgi:hypothetical protein